MKNTTYNVTIDEYKQFWIDYMTKLVVEFRRIRSTLGNTECKTRLIKHVCENNYKPDLTAILTNMIFDENEPIEFFPTKLQTK